jgi:AAA domain
MSAVPVSKVRLRDLHLVRTSSGPGHYEVVDDDATGPDVWEPPPPTVAFTGLGQLLNEAEEVVDYLVKDRIAFGSVNLLAGKPKAGKSTAARALALEVARGGSWLGAACLPRPVWYAVLEDKRSEVRRHYRQMGATGQEPVRFIFAADDTLLEKLHALARHEHPGLIVVDTLQRLIKAENLNDYAEVTTKLTPVLRLARDTNAAVVLVHHAGKADRAGIDTVLGSTALAGSVDNIFLVNRTERYRLLSSIQRIGPDLPETVITMSEQGQVLAGPSRHDADVDVLQQALVAALHSGSLTRADLLDQVEARRQVKLEALRKAVASGTIIRSGAGSKVDPHRFSLPVGSGSGSEVPSIGWEPESSFSGIGGFPMETKTDCGSQVPTVPEVPTGTTIVVPEPECDVDGDFTLRIAPSGVYRDIAVEEPALVLVH